MATRSAVKSCASKLTKAEKKALRKQIRQVHGLRKHNAELANVSQSPTPHLMIGNGGLMCGVDRTQIVNLFQKFGKIERILMLPGRSYSLITFQNADESSKAMGTLHGRVLESPSEFPRPGVSLYLSYLMGLPDDDVTVESQGTPPGLVLVDDFVTETEEELLMEALKFGFESQEDEIQGTADRQLRHRKVKHFGYEFLYGTNNVDKSKPLEGGIPSVCDTLLDHIQEYVKYRPDQMTINEYQPGQGIPPHVDTHSAFEDGIVSLSLGSQVTMEFRHPDGDHVSVVLPRRSLLVMTGDSRYLWSHGITPRRYDIVTDDKSMPSEEFSSNAPTEASKTETEKNHAEMGTTLFERQMRLSLTLRKIRHTPCTCKFPSQCDSQGYNKNDSKNPTSSNVPTSEKEAQDLEKTHVHQVYEQIAEHFSGTRHSPWPKIAEFLREQPVGSLVADVGCGNGKYLGINDSIFKTGSDRSLNLATICKERGFAVIVCDILSLPYRSDAFDVCLCIAVLHHLSTDDRRLAGLRELVRITRPGGLVLVYVWALEQEVKKVKREELREVKFEERKDLASEEDNKFSAEDHRDRETAKSKSDNEEGKSDERRETVLETNETVKESNSAQVRVNLSRDSFEQQDLFVPWRYSGCGIKKEKLKKEQDSEEAKDAPGGHVYHRFYHVFQDGELQELCSRLDHVTIRDLYYEKGNWCIILEKNEQT